MRCEIDEPQQLEALTRNWETNTGPDSASVIRQIEDLPSLESVANGTTEWVVDEMFAAGSLHLVTGDAGAGKSTFVSAMAHAVSRGHRFLGRATIQRPVLFLDAENPIAAIRERFERLGIESHDEFRIWGQWVGCDPPGIGEPVIADWVARCNLKPLIVIDSLIAFNPGAENDSTEMRRHLAQYRKLCATGATLIVLHHVGKSETAQDYRGSSDIKASIDIGYKLKNLEDPSRLSLLELRAFKQRFSVTPYLQIKYDDGVLALAGTQGSGKSPKIQTLSERFQALLQKNPGTSKEEFERLALTLGLGRNRARDFLNAGVKQGTIRIDPGPTNRISHFWRDVAQSSSLD
ncbi:MAG: AAA family ATPase [Acidobacteriota bacterium]|nr:AAA family ATPase [Acidobacteriota bacterium]